MTNQPTNRPTDRRTKRGVESRSTRLKTLMLSSQDINVSNGAFQIKTYCTTIVFNNYPYQWQEKLTTSKKALGPYVTQSSIFRSNLREQGCFLMPYMFIPVMAAVAVRKKVVSIGHFSPSFCFWLLQIFLFVRSNQKQLYELIALKIRKKKDRAK